MFRCFVWLSDQSCNSPTQTFRVFLPNLKGFFFFFGCKRERFWLVAKGVVFQNDVKESMIVSPLI
jgi:hypothetical protein